MKLIDLEQGTEAWKELRRSKIGSSDASTILGINPWETPLKLWTKKVEGIETEANFAMKRGTALEPIARGRFQALKGFQMNPKVALHDTRDWQIASLDGLSEDGKAILEIKCGGKELHEKAQFGIIPEYYMAQIQHQFAVTDAEKAYYVSFNGEDMEILEVERNDKFIKKLVKAEEEFFDMLQKKEAPAMTDKDYQPFYHERASDLLASFLEESQKEKTAKSRKDMFKEELIEISPKRPFVLDGTRIYESSTTSYDFNQMRIDGIDLEKYKKSSKPFWKIDSR